MSVYAWFTGKGRSGFGYASTAEEVTQGLSLDGKTISNALKVTASPILVDGKIYAITDDGTVYVYPATTSFKLLAKNSIGEPVMATPAVADNRLFIRGKTHLYCIGKPADKRATQP